MADKETLEVYARRAEDYARRFKDPQDNGHLMKFLDRLPFGGRVLDLGCGPGAAAAVMAERGFEVDAWDASPEMVQIARDRHGLNAQVAAFDDLDATAIYDGIYASFSLLHARKTEMPGYLARIAAALKPGGTFYIGLKTGEGEKRDPIGRFYAFYTDAEITGLLEDAGFDVDSRATGEEPGLDGVVAPWIILHARLR